MLLSKYSTKMISLNQEYETPDELFDSLNKEFNFEVDMCASIKNHKLPFYYTKKDDCFTKKLNCTTWCNPPFYSVKKFVKYNFEQSKNEGSTIVMLILVKSNTNWWRDYVFKAKEVRFINQKLQFKNTKQGLRFPACIVIFKPHENVTQWSVMESMS